MLLRLDRATAFLTVESRLPFKVPPSTVPDALEVVSLTPLRYLLHFLFSAFSFFIYITSIGNAVYNYSFMRYRLGDSWF